MKLLEWCVILCLTLVMCNRTNAATVSPAMNVSSQGSNYIFVYRGNNPTEFDALVAYNPVGWTATCSTGQACTGQTATIDSWSRPDPDYLFLYTKNSDGTAYIPSSGAYYSFSSPPPPPPPCCSAGSPSVFVPNSYNTTRLQTYNSRPAEQRMAQIYIEQIGSNNITTIEQTGTKDNHAEYASTGNNNTVSILQSGDITASNYTDLGIAGNNNSVSIVQQGTGLKGAFVKINDNNNSLLLNQKDSGSHYAEVTLSGGNKNVDILQQGSASHVASVGLTGNPTDLSLTQSGAVQHFYSIQFNCATAGGCAKITVQQGQ